MIEFLEQLRETRRGCLPTEQFGELLEGLDRILCLSEWHQKGTTFAGPDRGCLLVHLLLQATIPMQLRLCIIYLPVRDTHHAISVVSLGQTCTTMYCMYLPGWGHSAPLFPTLAIRPWFHFEGLALTVLADSEARMPVSLQPKGGHKAELGILNALFWVLNLLSPWPWQDCHWLVPVFFSIWEVGGPDAFLRLVLQASCQFCEILIILPT